MKIVFITDTHFRGTTPKNRKDDFLLTLKAKLTEVVNYCNNNSVDLLLHGGDFFDRPDVSPSVFKDFAKILFNCNCPIYGVHGNHDIYAQNPSTLPRTMLGILDGLEIVNLLDKEPIVIDSDIKLQLTGCGYSYDIEQKENYIVSNTTNSDYCIHIVHGMLLPRKSLPTEKLTTIDQIRSTEADITLTGHYHGGFGIYELDNKYFINPGALVRIDNSLTEIKRQPKILEINLDKRSKPTIKEIPLKSVQKGEHILDRSEIEARMEKESKLIDFLDGILDISNNKLMVIEEIVSSIAENTGVDEVVKRKALEVIANIQSDFSEQDIS
ncbi:metallophosphoesterase [Alkalicella caledoniensis]|uniref:Metallophosphoesterase n=1 Tax=Alkalicella caledoniensis TaxID=2731377 RepID=A0A7G9WCT7_ALKCA|nr:metallophosphoesterase [Alkalicella caledoniensis]QNO16499.1 metallophosphoesterase [Alkalicella caledoniensis]